MKAKKKTRYKYTKPVPDFKGFSVSQSCNKLTLKFTFDSRHLILTTLELLSYKLKVTRKSVMKLLKDNIYYKGHDYFDNMIHYEITDFRSDSVILQEAHDTVKKLFPEYFDISNAEHFIKEAP